MDSRLARALALAAAIAIPAEGLRQVAYHDPGGVLTVCYGHTGKDVVKGKNYSLDECKALLDKDMLAALATVERCHPGLPDSVLVSFADGVYNLGPVVACDLKESQAARYLAAGEYVKACKQLPRWNLAKVAGVKVVLPGLTKRREMEREVCLEGVS